MVENMKARWEAASHPDEFPAFKAFPPGHDARTRKTKKGLYAEVRECYGLKLTGQKHIAQDEESENDIQAAQIAETYAALPPDVLGTAVEGHSASPADQQEVVASAASSLVLLDDVDDLGTAVEAHGAAPADQQEAVASAASSSIVLEEPVLQPTTPKANRKRQATQQNTPAKRSKRQLSQLANRTSLALAAGVPQEILETVEALNDARARNQILRYLSKPQAPRCRYHAMVRDHLKETLNGNKEDPVYIRHGGNLENISPVVYVDEKHSVGPIIYLVEVKPLHQQHHGCGQAELSAVLSHHAQRGGPPVMFKPSVQFYSVGDPASQHMEIYLIIKKYMGQPSKDFNSVMLDMEAYCAKSQQGDTAKVRECHDLVRMLSDTLQTSTRFCDVRPLLIVEEVELGRTGSNQCPGLTELLIDDEPSEEEKMQTKNGSPVWRERKLHNYQCRARAVEMQISA